MKSRSFATAQDDKLNKRSSRFAVVLFLLAALAALPAPAGAAFGQNKLVVHDFRWRVVSTEHFDIHYSPEAELLVPRAAYHLEKSFREVTSDLEIEIKHRTPFFLFANHNQFEENNVVDVGEGTGGVTEAFKNRFLVFNDGREFWMSHVIEHEFTHVCQFEVLYGGFWKSARLLKSPLYPLWFMEGMPEYETGNLDRAEEDLYIRDAATSDRLYPLMALHGFAHLKPHEVTLGYKQGAAALRFLADEYGRGNVPDVLKMLRERFEVSSIIGDLTGQDFGSFDRRYREFVTDYYASQSEGCREPDAYGRKLTSDDILPVFETNPTLSPDGARMAYLSDASGLPEVMLYDFATSDVRRLSGREWNKVEHLHPEGRALSFSPDGRWLAFAGEKKQRDFVYLYDLKRDRLRRIRTPFEQVRSPVFHPAGDRLVVVGMRRGVNDLYELTPRGKLLRRLTDTPADKTGPVCSPDGRTVVYSEETVSTDTIRGGVFAQRDLVALDLATLSTAALTGLPQDETAAAFLPDGKTLLFVGEADGMPNLYRLDLAEGRARQLTKVFGGNFGPDVSRDGKRMAFSSFRRGSQRVYEAKPETWAADAGTDVAGVQPSARTWTALAESGKPARTEAPAQAARSPWKGNEGLFAGNDRPYRFRASTDLFFPLFFYSSTDGLFIAAFWQASEYLGNHQLQTTLQYSSGNDFLDYQAQYTYRRFRPQFFVSAGGQNFFTDFAKSEFRKETREILGVSYPLDRFNRIETSFGSIYHTDRIDNLPQFNTEERENLAAASFVRDTTTGRYLAVTEGRRFRTTYQIARPVFGGDRDYETYILEGHNFAPTGREGTVALRAIGGVSAGPSPQLFRLGGVDRIRGYSRKNDDNRAPRYVVGNLEWRVPLKYFDYYTWFIFPDFYFKAIYGTVFTDAGYDWTRTTEIENLKATRVKNSVGFGFRIPVFVLQTFLTTVSVDAAKRTDADRWVFYVSLGPVF